MPRYEQKPLSKDKIKELDEKFKTVDENYINLTSDKFGVFGKGGVFSSDYVRHLMVQDADRLVAILDGTIPERERISGFEAEEAPAPDIVIALDKSGRPLKAVAETFWESRAKKGVEMPEFDFLNIDRIDWLQRMGYSYEEADDSTQKQIDMSKVSHEEISRLRAYFVEGELSEDNWQEEVWQLPTRLDDKEVLILDEVKNSGATLEIAAKLIQAAAPKAKISGDYFWTERTYHTIGDESQWATVPPWYKRDSDMGRGIGDIDPSYYHRLYEKEKTQENLKKKIAAFAISAPHHNPETLESVRDEEYDALVQDLAYLTYEKHPWFPHVDREDDSWDIALDKMAEDLGVTVEELMQYRNQKIDEEKAKAKRHIPK